MKVVLGKRSLSKETEPRNHKMPIDFIDQLSKFEEPLDIRRPFVIGAVTDESTNKDLQAKDVVVTLNGQAAKYIDQAKAILEQQRKNHFCNGIARSKEKKSSYN
jgi:regulator of sigma E protease